MESTFLREQVENLVAKKSLSCILPVTMDMISKWLEKTSLLFYILCFLLFLWRILFISKVDCKLFNPTTIVTEEVQCFSPYH